MRYDNNLATRLVIDRSVIISAMSTPLQTLKAHIEHPHYDRAQPLHGIVNANSKLVTWQCARRDRLQNVLEGYTINAGMRVVNLKHVLLDDLA